MRPLGHRRQVLLFLVAILVPCLVLVGLSVRMIGQEQELADKRRTDERRHLLEQVRQELLARLEFITLEEVDALSRSGEVSRPAVYRNPAVVFVGWMEDDKLVLPWERNPAVEQFRKLAGQSDFESSIRQGEQQEFAGTNLEGAVRSYREAMDRARHPAQVAYARLMWARALDKLGRRQEAQQQFQILLALPSEMVDEDGVPLRLYAAERLLEPGGRYTVVLATLRDAASARPPLPPAGCYILSGLVEKLTRLAPDARARETAEELRQKVSAQIRQFEQAAALQNDFPRLSLPEAKSGRVGTDWILYGEETWLVGAAAAPGPRSAIIAIRAREVFASVEARWKRFGQVRFVVAREAKGELLGENFPGLKVAFATQADAALLRQGGLQRGFYYAALLLVLGVTLFGAYLLWRDLQRELRLAEVRAQFVSSVSHELKTPLTAIRMFAETLQMGRSQDPATQAEYLDTIVNECERLTRLVDDVLLFSKIEQGKKAFQFRPTSLAEVVNGAARALQYPLEQQGFELQVSVADELPPSPADRDALQQAILNLLTNAMKYSGEARTIELALTRNDAEALIRVTDHGVGIAPEEHARIFEKYYRAPTRENQLIPGTGLGLTLVAQIVKAHGGRVEVKSAPGQGSTFSVCLPLGSES